jgi:A/G-specific adenine glycosylase
MEFGAVVCKPQNPLCKICHLQKYCKFFNGKNYISLNKKFSIKEKKINIYFYLNKYKKEIVLTKNKNLSFFK